MSHKPRGSPPETTRPRLEVADIFREHGEVYRQSHTVTLQQRRAMQDIETCRTAALGGHMDECDSCGYQTPAYNSCRNRHCPKCQSLSQALWLERQKQRILPTHYFHVVFTLPSQLRALALRNRQWLFARLFQAASETLLALGQDQTRLGARLGITAVLHTWTRELRFHPHIHCIVTGGGLSPQGDSWLPLPQNYAFPFNVLSRLFRGKFLDALSKAYDKGALHLQGTGLESPTEFRRLKAALYRKDWIAYAKAPFGGAQQVFAYLGRYTHRVAISNHRLQAMDTAGVRFATKHGRTTTIPPQDFIGRFLQHVLPKGFVKIRHYGLMASGAKAKLVLARKHLEASARHDMTTQSQTPFPVVWSDQLLALTGIDPFRCPRCKAGTLVRRPLTTIGQPVERPPPWASP